MRAAFERVPVREVVGSEALVSTRVTSARFVSYVAVTSIFGVTTVIWRSIASCAAEVPDARLAAGWTRTASVVPCRPLAHFWFCPGTPR